MKINANEMLLINRVNNQKGINSAVSYMAEVPQPEQTSNTMKALQVQGMNNMSFQGGVLAKPLSDNIYFFNASAGIFLIKSSSLNLFAAT